MLLIGEKKLLKKNKIKYFWYIHNNAVIIRKNFIKEFVLLKILVILIFYMMEIILEVMGLRVRL